MEIRALSKLQQLATPRFRLAAFELVPLEFEPDELLLEEIVATVDPDSKVIPIFAGAPSADQRNCMQRQLDARQQQQRRSASDELAEALAELRRSLR